MNMIPCCEITNEDNTFKSVVLSKMYLKLLIYIIKVKHLLNFKLPFYLI